MLNPHVPPLTSYYQKSNQTETFGSPPSFSDQTRPSTQLLVALSPSLPCLFILGGLPPSFN